MVMERVVGWWSGELVDKVFPLVNKQSSNWQLSLLERIVYGIHFPVLHDFIILTDNVLILTRSVITSTYILFVIVVKC